MSPMQNRLMVPQKLPLLLDFAPGAAAAYSLRSLSNGYTGPVITARRASDSAEAEFTAAEVIDGSLAAWSSGGDAFVKVWHDQSGNGRDASQTTTAAQPKIVSGGSVVLEEGKPAIQFDGSDDVLVGITDMPAIANMLALVVCSGDASGTNLERGFVSQGTGTPTAYTSGYWLERSTYSAAQNIASYVVGDNISSGTGDLPNTGFPQSVITQHRQIGIESAVYLNFIKVASETAPSNQRDATIPAETLYVGKTLQTHIGKMQEVIIYPSDMTAYRERIEGNIVWSYST